ncbi:hypothetical protein VKT23_005842 [Stygiomarasmius scandens]|uniref:Uncharacterized protein n=1 Tax=Marasmiellus scandens TaxID=2682957 RepID=A0ABR1IUQ6_9AGAR
MEVIFSNKTNILEALLLTKHDNSPIYQLKSTFGLTGRKLTFLKDVNPISPSSNPTRHYARHSTNTNAKKEPVTVGVIHWREKVFEIQGVKKNIGDIKKKKGLLSKSRYWKWADDRKEYEVRHDGDKEWVVTYCPPPAPSPTSTSPKAKSKEPESKSEPTVSKDKPKDKDKRPQSSSRREPSSSSANSNSKSPRPRNERSASSTSSAPTDLSTSSSQTALDKSPTHAGTFAVPYRPKLFSSKHPPSCTLTLNRLALEEDEIFLILVLIYSEARRQEGMNSSVGSGVEGI